MQARLRLAGSSAHSSPPIAQFRLNYRHYYLKHFIALITTLSTVVLLEIRTSLVNFKEELAVVLPMQIALGLVL
jgi:hypothetical protein